MCQYKRYTFQPLVTIKRGTELLETLRMAPFQAQIKDCWWKHPEFYSNLQTVTKEKILSKRYPFTDLPSKVSNVSCQFLMYKNPEFEFIIFDRLPTDYSSFVLPDRFTSINLHCVYNLMSDEEMEIWNVALLNQDMECVDLGFSSTEVTGEEVLNTEATRN